jgi:hypothetical protein
MSPQMIIKDKETGEILQCIHIWAVFLLLTFYGEFNYDRNKIQIFFDDKEFPIPEVLKGENPI